MPLKSPDAQQYEAMARIFTTSDGKEMCRWLTESRKELLELLSDRDEEPGVMRGETRALKQIIAALTDSQEPARLARRGDGNGRFF